MKSIPVFVCTVGLMAGALLSTDPERLTGPATDGASSVSQLERPMDNRRIDLVRSRSAYDVHRLTAPTDRSIEVLDGDAFAWRRRKSRLA